MGLGVAQCAIDSMRKVERQLGHVNASPDDRPDDLQKKLDALAARIMILAQTTYGRRGEYCTTAIFQTVQRNAWQGRRPSHVNISGGCLGRRN